MLEAVYFTCIIRVDTFTPPTIDSLLTLQADDIDLYSCSRE